MKIEIRDAKENDSKFVAWTVFTALNEECDDLDRFALLCKKEKSLYSYTNARIAVADGKAVGCVISYQGKDYLPLRKITWPEFLSCHDTACSDNTDIETIPGEYYVDSFALLPDYRGTGIGKALLSDSITKGKALGCE